METSQMKYAAMHMSTNFTDLFSAYEKDMLNLLGEDIIICLECKRKDGKGGIECLGTCSVKQKSI